MIIEYRTKYPSIYVRLHGRNGSVREYCALMDLVSDYCIIPRVDAYRLGYPEASHADPVTRPSNLVMLAGSTGYAEGMMLLMKEVEIGDLKLESIPFLGLDLPQVVTYDIVLGRNFLESAGLTLAVDSAARKIKISKEN